MSRYIPGQHRPTLEDPVNEPIIDITDRTMTDSEHRLGITPAPPRVGWPIGDCGHAVSHQEWGAGIRTCGAEAADAEALVKPTWHHKYSLSGDSREHAVPCRFCRASTWNICGYCNEDCPCGEVD